MIAPFSILKGVDETGSVVKSVKYLYRFISLIEESIYPEVMRYVVMQGEIDIGFPTQDVRMMDGPAFHDGSKKMSDLKLFDKVNLYSNKYFFIDTGGRYQDILLTNEINLILSIKYNWKTDDYHIYTQYKQGEKMKNIGYSLHITEQAVSKRINQKGIKMIIESVYIFFSSLPLL